MKMVKRLHLESIFDKNNRVQILHTFIKDDVVVRYILRDVHGKYRDINNVERLLLGGKKNPTYNLPWMSNGFTALSQSKRTG